MSFWVYLNEILVLLWIFKIALFENSVSQKLYFLVQMYLRVLYRIIVVASVLKGKMFSCFNYLQWKYINENQGVHVKYMSICISKVASNLKIHQDVCEYPPSRSQDFFWILVLWLDGAVAALWSSCWKCACVCAPRTLGGITAEIY